MSNHYYTQVKSMSSEQEEKDWTMYKQFKDLAHKFYEEGKYTDANMARFQADMIWNRYKKPSSRTAGHEKALENSLSLAVHQMYEDNKVYMDATNFPIKQFPKQEHWQKKH
jgi:hypothetical protein